MKLNLAHAAADSQARTLSIELEERLPERIEQGCKVGLNYQVERLEDYYLLHLKTEALLNIFCERCANSFHSTYRRHSCLAICKDDARAEDLMSQHEVITAALPWVDLKTLIIDELHLYAPCRHEAVADCHLSV